MSSAERSIAIDTAGMDRIVRALQGSWPSLVTIMPSTLEANGTLQTEDFLSAVQVLSDQGLISYEAIVIGAGEPRLIDAGLTARGRAYFGPTPPSSSGGKVRLADSD